MNFLDSLLFVLPAWLIRDNIEEVGFLLTMFIFVQATGIVILPINELAMVASAAHVGAGDHESLEQTSSTLFKLLLVLAGALVAVAYPFRQPLLRLAIGNPNVLAGVEGYALLLTCIIPITVYGGLKGIIDMRWKAPRNLLNLVLGHGIGVGVFMALHHGYGARAAVVAGSVATIWVLGLLTPLTLRSLLRAVEWKRLAAALAFVAVSMVANHLLSAALVSRGVPWVPQLGIMLLSMALTVGLALRLVEPTILRWGIERARRLIRQMSFASGASGASKGG